MLSSAAITIGFMQRKGLFTPDESKIWIHFFKNNLLKIIFLIVSTKLSGNFGKIEHFRFPPDGHVEHSGCWPADVYYAVDYDQWTDTITNTDATRIENKNVPGDGKLDQTRIPAKVNYIMGRIDHGIHRTYRVKVFNSHGHRTLDL